jgi:hypothetical protein
LRDHMRRHLPDHDPDACHECHQTLGWNTAFVKSEKSSLLFLDSSCHLCNKSYRKTCDLERHMEITHPDHELETCDECKSFFSTPSSNYCVETNSLPANNSDALFATNDGSFFTPETYSLSHTDFVPVEHLVEDHQAKPFCCKFEGCDFKSKYRGSLNSHVRSFHQKIRKYKCHFCGHETKCKSHQRTHGSLTKNNITLIHAANVIRY